MMNTRLPNNKKIEYRASRLKAAKTREELAEALGFSYRFLNYYIHGHEMASHYAIFNITKKSGGERKIAAPNEKLKRIQKNLSEILAIIYEPKHCVHSFAHGKNIATNARPHLRAKHILRLDLKDFFPSIHFGRVRGLFEAQPFDFPRAVSTFLARICCLEGALPQGAPTSPIISNMICLRMDAQLTKLARDYQCKYTRYADDITFSTKKDRLPKEILKLSSKLQLSKNLIKIIKDNFFEINFQKVRLSSNKDSKFIAGVKVNTKLNVARSKSREIRAMLHAFRKFGPDKALEEHLLQYSRQSLARQTNFYNIVQGKIAHLGMIRGNLDPLVLKLKMELEHAKEIYGEKINKRVFERGQYHIQGYQAIIFPEGKTDNIYLKFAYHNLKAKGLLKDLHIFFHTWTVVEGCTAGCNDLKAISQKGDIDIYPNCPKIYIFDRDIASLTKYTAIKDISGQRYEGPKYWGANSWSLLLHEPFFRQGYGSSLSIEHFFPDDIIFSSDSEGRRLYQCKEFADVPSQQGDPKIFLHKDDSAIYITSKQNKGPYALLGEGVMRDGKNIARSKFSLAISVVQANDLPKQSAVEFIKIFESIQNIIKRSG